MRKDDVLYYYGPGMTRLAIEDNLERLSETDRCNLAARLKYAARQVTDKKPDLQQAALALSDAWEVMGIKYLAPPEKKVRKAHGPERL